MERKTMIISRIEIQALRTSVHLGVPAQERSILQEVEWTVRIGFHSEPRATKTDQIEDTVCYAELCSKLAEVARQRPYRLIESLAREGYIALRKTTGPDCAIEISLHKLQPPIEGLREGVKFVYGDEIR